MKPPLNIKIGSTISIQLPAEYEPRVLPFFEKWMEALESGEFSQTTGTLQYHDNFCCLGVLCKTQGRLIDGYDGQERCCLPEGNPCFSELSQEGNFPLGCTVTYRGTEMNSLAALNDRGATFEEIAKVIRVFWKE